LGRGLDPPPGGERPFSPGKTLSSEEKGFRSQINPRKAGKDPFDSGLALAFVAERLFRREMAFSSGEKGFSFRERAFLGISRLFLARLLAGRV
jgi:hypothetical protein